MTIGICDDIPQLCSEVSELVSGFMRTTRYDYEIETFQSGTELIKKRPSLDVLFLDVEMPGYDGFETAKQLREKGSEAIIIFLTSHEAVFQKAFKVNAFRYLLKPVKAAEVEECLRDAIKKLFSDKKILVDDNRRQVLVAESKLLYIESIGDKSVIHAEGSTDLISGKTLKTWLTELSPGRFIQCHKSYIVSFEHIVSHTESGLCMKNGETIPVSTRNSAAVRSGINRYISTSAKG